MTKVAYTYCIVRYLHDPAAGEMLNVGALLYSPGNRYFGFRLQTRFKRLSEAYAGFDGEQYRRVLRQFETAMSRLWQNLSDGIPGMFDLPGDVGVLASKVWPDSDLSFRLGPALAGVTEDAERALEDLYARIVLNQYERSIGDHRDDDDIWADFARPLPTEVRRVLHEKTIETDDYELRFPHAFKNGQWHLLQPVTLDYSNTSNIQEKASRWLGRATLLRDNPEVAQLYLLLGAPRQERNSKAYDRAKNILAKVPLPHQIIEENEAEDFARYLRDYMREHGILPEVGRVS